MACTSRYWAQVQHSHHVGSRRVSWKKFVAEKVTDNPHPDLDDLLFKFVFSDETSKMLPELSGERRLHLHTRASTMGLKTTSIPDKLSHGSKRGPTRGPITKTLKLDKPAAWKLPESPLPLPRKPPPVAHRPKRARRTKSCQECGCVMERDDANYHWSGLGPLCWDCIEADEELVGLKWEELPSRGF